MKGFVLQLLSATHGQGPSSTRLIYLLSHLSCTLSALIASLGGVYAYCQSGRADGAYWAGVASLWMATLGCGTFAKSRQAKPRANEAQQADDHKDLSGMVLQPAPAMSGD